MTNSWKKKSIIFSLFQQTLSGCLIILCILVGDGITRKPAQRVASLAPHITEMIFKIGAGNRLVARTDFCTYPDSVKQIPSIGGYLNINFEKLVQLQPDLVLQYPNAENRRKLENLGFRVAGIPNDTVEDILDGLLKVGKLLNKEAKAVRVKNGIEDTLRHISQIADKFNKPVKAILVVGRQPGSLEGLYLSGPKTYLSQIWEMSGGKNVFEDVSRRYFPVNKEDLLIRNVEMILEFHPGWNLTDTKIKKEMEVCKPFENISAVKESNIYLFSDRYFVVPGPRISKIAIKFSGLIQSYIAESP